MTNTQTLKIEEAARRLRVSRGSAYAAVRRGEIPSIRIGRLLFVPRPAFEKMLSGRGGGAMKRQTKMSSGASCRGRAAGRENSPLMEAIHRKYNTARGSDATGLPIYVHGPNGRRVAGHVVTLNGRRTLRKTNVQARHYCVKHGGYGFEISALQQAQRLGATVARLEFADSNRVIEVPFATLAANGIPDELGGFGLQIFLPLHHWREVGG